MDEEVDDWIDEKRLEFLREIRNYRPTECNLIAWGYDETQGILAIHLVDTRSRRRYFITFEHSERDRLRGLRKKIDEFLQGGMNEGYV